MQSNIYFELTEEFNAARRIAVLTSGQAGVFHRVAIMSKDGDWILEETEEATGRVREILARRGARYRLGAPLDVRWLAGGWSSHFEFSDEKERRVRCDFLTRPPRLPGEAIAQIFCNAVGAGGLSVIQIEPLIVMKQTQRAKDYAVITELARLLPADRELELTWDPDRILELAHSAGAGSTREAVVSAREGLGREEVAVALAREASRLQVKDQRRLEAYARAAQDYAHAFQAARISQLDLPDAHARAVDLAQKHLPVRVR